MSDNPSDASGLACDRDCVVIDLRSYRFHQHCLITGEPVDGEHSRISFYSWELLPSQPETDETVKEALRSDWRIGPLRVLTIALRVPLQTRWQKRSHAVGIGLLVAGSALATLGVVCAMIGVVVWQWPAAILVVPAVIGALLVAAGANALVKQHAPLSVHRLADGLVWLKGVHPAVRQPLPSWRNSAVERAYSVRVARNRFAVGGLSLILGAVLLTTQYHNLVDAIGSRSWSSTPGKITSSKIVTTVSGGGRNSPRNTTYQVDVQYTFTVQDAPYSGHRIGFRAPSSFSSRRAANDLQQRYYRVGQAVKVFYRASDPSRCALSTASVGDVFDVMVPLVMALTIGVVFIALGIVTVWQMSKRRMELEEKNPGGSEPDSQPVTAG